tara:strand:+ start:559 stop:1026 length:468 start_codon:yes stop_codon:yes gene_type:complete
MALHIGQATLGDEIKKNVHNKAMLDYTYDKMAIAARIQERMDETGVTRENIAEACDVSKQAVQQWFKNGNIAIERFPILRNLLGCSIDDLIVGSTKDNQAAQLAAQLAGRVSPRSLDVLRRIEKAAIDGNLKEEDIILLDTIARRFENGSPPRTS